MTTLMPPYTSEQLAQYVDYIHLPRKYYPSSSLQLEIELLTALHVHQISTIPYENLSLHYSTHHSISLDPQHLFRKFVIKGCNRGGYCMEVSLMFLWMLQKYGFDVYPTGVRIRLREGGVPQGDFIGL
jgi:arylamine N-acetyltransferase